MQLLALCNYFPTREERRLIESVMDPILGNHTCLKLLLLIPGHQGFDNVLDVPGMLILQKACFTFVQELERQAGDIWFVAEFRDRGEQGLEVEDDTSR